MVSGELTEIKKAQYTIRCNNCSRTVELEQLISQEDAENSLDFLRSEYNGALEYSQKALEALKNDYKCYLCLNNNFKVPIISTHQSDSPYKIIIHCQSCQSEWPSLNEFILAYKEWQQKAAMMIALKAHEQALISEAIQNKNIRDINFVQEELIDDNDQLNNAARFFIIEAVSSTESTPWAQIYSKVRLCNRPEKLLLLEIVDICLVLGSETGWNIKTPTFKSAKFLYCEPEKPIAVLLFEKTKFLNIRKILRSLMGKCLVQCGEGKNFLEVSSLLAQNKALIRQLLEPQNIKNELRHLIFSRDKYSCYHCGENGRSLKIAFLSADKDINDLNDMISLCDICHHELTNQDLLIDGSISSLSQNDLLPEDKYISYVFVKTYLSEADSKHAFGLHEELLEDYGEEEIIKALAITLNKNKESGIGTIQGFYGYARAILKNSPEGVNISKRVSEFYNTDEWISRL